MATEDEGSMATVRLSWEEMDAKRAAQEAERIALTQRDLDQREQLLEITASEIEQRFERIDKERAEDAEFRREWLAAVHEEVRAIGALAASIAKLAESQAKS